MISVKYQQNGILTFGNWTYSEFWQFFWSNSMIHYDISLVKSFKAYNKRTSSGFLFPTLCLFSRYTFNLKLKFKFLFKKDLCLVLSPSRESMWNTVGLYRAAKLFACFSPLTSPTTYITLSLKRQYYIVQVEVVLHSSRIGGAKK